MSPEHSIRALTDFLVGALIAVLTITLPIYVVLDYTNSKEIVTINKDE